MKMDMFAHQFRYQDNYQLPSKLNLISNQHQLKNKRKKLLKQYYDKNAQQKHTSRMRGNERRSRESNSSELYSNHSSSLPNIGKISLNKYSHSLLQPQYEKDNMLRQILAKDLDEQIRNRQIQKRLQKKLSLQSEKDIIYNVSKVFLNEQQSERQMKLRIQKDLKQDYFKALQKKYKQKQQIKKEQQQYHMKYVIDQNPNRYKQRLSQGDVLSQHMKEINYNLSNSPSQKRVYVNKIQFSQKNKQKPEQQKVANHMNYKHISDSIPSYSNKLSPKNIIYNPQLQIIESYKQTLLKQIEQMKERRKQTKRKEHFSQYTTAQQKKRHNPINNPIDFKMANDNIYILKELQGVD